MGEETWRVHRTGAPSLDHLRRSTLLDHDAVEARLGIDLSIPPLLAAYHPVTLDEDPSAGIHEVLSPLDELAARPIIFCYPNADAGGRAVRDAIAAFTATCENAHLLVNLDPYMYWSLLRCAAAMYGNSSSGIMESPSVSVPAINIGPRQDGRERAANIIDVPPKAELLKVAIDRVLGRDHVPVENPYGAGPAADRIARVLAEVTINDRLLHKPALSVEPINAHSRDHSAAPARSRSSHQG